MAPRVSWTFPPPGCAYKQGGFHCRAHIQVDHLSDVIDHDHHLVCEAQRSTTWWWSIETTVSSWQRRQSSRRRASAGPSHHQVVLVKECEDTCGFISHVTRDKAQPGGRTQKNGYQL